MKASKIQGKKIWRDKAISLSVDRSKSVIRRFS
jgi:hypothetical protein